MRKLSPVPLHCHQTIHDKLAFNYIIPAHQSAFTCSKLTIETLKQGVKYV